MARLARLVLPGIARHVTHRGNRRGDIFLDRTDRDSRLVGRAEEWPWSSAAAHGGLGENDPLLDPERPFPDAERTGGSWLEWLALEEPSDEANAVRLRRRTSTGRPCGEVERRLGR